MSPSPAPPATTPVQMREWRLAYNSSKRRQTVKPDGSVRQRAGSLAYLYNKAREAIRIRLIDTELPYKTANWQWDGKSHVINVHRDVPSVFFSSEGTNTSPRRIGLAKAVVAHEVCHGLYTSRSPDAGDDCARVGIPFRLLNLMEDCRIEHAYVTQRGKDHKFNWKIFDDFMPKTGDTIKSPSDWLFTMKRREPVLFKHPSSVMAPYKWGGAAMVMMPTVSYIHPLKEYEGLLLPTVGVFEKFYAIIVAAKSTEELVPIAAYWKDTFGAESASDLPPILVRTVPSSFGDKEDPMESGGSSGASEAIRTPDHKPVDSLTGGPLATGRSAIYEDRVVHSQAGDVLARPTLRGLIPLAKYLQNSQYA